MNVIKYIGTGALVVLSFLLITENARADLSYKDSTGLVSMKMVILFHNIH
jgi:hypothetical protein